MTLHSKRSLEGLLTVDCRAGTGIERKDLVTSGIPVVPAGTLLECPTFMCGHCNGMVVMNPERTRERHYCQAGDHYTCDVCADDTECRPFMKYIEDILAGKGASNG